MCEVLVRVVDKVNAEDPYQDVKCLKRGDVVDAFPDGHKWSREELGNSYWRILKLPQVSLAQAQLFLGPDMPQDPEHPNPMLRRRAYKFDVDLASLPAALKAYLRDQSRAAGSYTINASPATILSYRVAKTPLADPQVL